MCKSGFLFLFLLIPAVNNQLFAQEGYLLNNLYFSGNESFSVEELSEKVSLYTLNWFETVILRKDRFVFSEEYLEADLKNLRSFYQQQGYLNVQIKSDYLHIDDEDQTVDLQILISENQPVLVKETKYTLSNQVNSGLFRVDSLFGLLKRELNLLAGNHFQDNLLAADKEQIITGFLNAGFAYVEVEENILLSEDEESVEINWLINTGPLCRFGPVEISETKYVSQELIRERNDIQQGGLYKQELLDSTHQNIFALGLFQVVSVKARLHEDKLPIIPVRIDVKEAPKYTTKFGVGYGSEDRFRAFADILRLSFLGGARRLNLLLSFSGLQPYNIDLRFTQPSFLLQRMVLMLNPYTRKQDEPGYKVSRTGIKTTLLYALFSNVTSSLMYTKEDVKRDTVDYQSDDYLDERYTGLYDKSMTNIGLTWDTSYPMFYPEQGFLISMNMQYNGIFTFVEYPFQKMLFDFRYFQKVFSFILALRLKTGGIKPLRWNNFIPVEERFYAGGSYSMRGWARHELGPKDSGGRPLGGQSLLEFSSELRFAIYDPVAGVAFMDCGNVWTDSYSWPLNEIRYSLGLGLRIKTPIGPVRLDVARPVFDEEKRVQFHFSVGHAF